MALIDVTPTRESDNAWLALLSTGVAFGITVLLFVLVLGEPLRCGPQRTPTPLVDKIFVGMLLVTSVLGVFTAGAAILARRADSYAATGWPLALGLLAPFACAVMLLLIVLRGLGCVT